MISIKDEKDYLYNDSVEDEFSRIHFNLEMSAIDKKIKKIIVTSSIKAEGKTIVSYNLSKNFAASGKKVALLDLNLRNKKKYRYYKMIKSGKNIDIEFIKEKTNGGFDKIVYEKEEVYPSRVIESIEFNNLIKDLELNYDIIIIDTPPVLDYLDAVVTLKATKDVLFVVRSDLTEKDDLKEAIGILEKAGANILGLVLTMDLKNYKNTG